MTDSLAAESGINDRRLDELSDEELVDQFLASQKAERERVDQLLGDVCRDWKDSVIVSDYIILGRNATEISAEFGMSEDLVYQRAHRLKERLRKWLDAHGFTSADAVLGGAKKKR